MRPEPFDVDALDGMSMAQLRSEWARLLGEAPPSLRAPELLRRELAQRVQMRIHGELDHKLRRHLDRLSKETPRKKPISPAVTPPVGATLMREWDGVRYTVIVLTDGYLFEGQAFKSLSRIASQITGVRWSGPRFFGLTGGAK